MIIDSNYSVYAITNLNSKNPDICKIDNSVINVCFADFIPTKFGRIASKVEVLFKDVVLDGIIQKHRVFLILPNTKHATYIYQKMCCKDERIDIYKTVRIIKNPNWEFTCDTLGYSESIMRGNIDYLNSISRVELNCLASILEQISNRYVSYSLEAKFYSKAIEACGYKKVIKSYNVDDLLTRIFGSIEKNLFGVPMIKEVIYNAPNTVVYWMDGTKTVVTATKGEAFNKEIGLAMAISKKYFSISNDEPRAAFKNTVKNASDYSAASEHKRKQKELKEAKKLEETKNGDNDNI